MVSESKWKQRRLEKPLAYEDNRDNDNAETYDKEDDNIVYDQGPTRNVVKFAAIIAGGYGAYKSGLLRGGVKKILEYASDYDYRGTDALSAFKTWVNDKGEKETDSILRAKFSLTKSAKNLKKAINDADYAQKVMDDTKADLDDFKGFYDKIIKDTKSKAGDVLKRDYKDTDLVTNINEAELTIKEMHTRDQDRNAAINKIVNDELLNFQRVTAENKAKQLKKTGFTQVTIGDVLRMTPEGYIDFKSPSNFKFDDTSMRMIQEGLLNKTITSKVPQEMIEQFGKIKDIGIDKNILIDKEGKIVDLRNSSKAFRFHMESLSDDYKIPFIQINPLAMFDFNHIYERKIKFGVIDKETFQPGITGKAGKTKLKDVDDTGDMLVAGDRVYKYNPATKEMGKLKDKFYVYEIPKHIKSRFGLPRELNVYRKILNLNFKDKTAYAPDQGKIKAFYYKFMRKLDLGFQDTNMKAEFNILDPTTYIMGIFKNKHISSLFNHIRPYDINNVTKIPMSEIFGRATGTKRTLIAFKKSVRINDVFNKDTLADKELLKNKGKQFLKQFVAGRKNFQDVTYTTSMTYYLFEKMNESIAPFGLGLSNESLGSIGDVYKNLLLKRYLPVVGVIGAGTYINYITQGKPDDEGNRDNIHKHIAEHHKNIDIGFHEIEDSIGLTKLFKNLAKIMPGIDQIGDLPGVNSLGLGQTAQERAQFFKTGMTPVRKGRFWNLGSTPFTGGKIEYFQPNSYRRVKSDYKFSNVMFGSRDEYFKNAAFPTLQHPLAPLRHFIFDRYHYENKHYQDRPYLLNSPMGDNIPIIGPVFSATIGKVLKPQIHMHPEYWASTQNKSDVYQQMGTNNINYTSSSNSPQIKNIFVAHGTQYRVPKSRSGSLVVNNSTSANVPNSTQSNNGNNSTDTYLTSSGNAKIVNLSNTNVTQVNTQLKDFSINKVKGISLKRSAEPNHNLKVQVSSPNNLSNTLSNEQRVISDTIGIYGYTATAFIVGQKGKNKTLLDTSGYMNSINRSFWDANIGGIGSDMSEIFRRFIPKKRTDVNYYDPVRNTMPTWMPGQNYFQNFQTGDPYSSISKGEFRLPGEGYERMWGIHNPLELQIGSTTLGKSQQEIVNHFLKKDTLIDEEPIKNAKADAAIRKRMSNSFLRSGLAIDIRGKINDTRNGIVGMYDARIHDDSSPHKEAIVDFKSTNATDLKKLKGPVESDVEKLNYHMYATKTKAGYMYYVDRNDNNNTKAYKVKYSQGMLNNTLNKLSNARAVIKNGISDGTIQRGDLYSIMDRFRILADTAPYSTEFKEIHGMIGRMDLNDDQKAEVSEILKRVQKQKEPMRVYNYKFSGIGLQNKKVHVTSIIDANTFMTKEFKNPIRLAGVHVSTNKADPNAAYSRRQLARYVHVGASLTLGISDDPSEQTAKDTLGTTHAIVYKGGKNVNKFLIDNGYGTEKDKDNSSTGIRARYSKGQILFGRAWEHISHSNSFFNTKLLQVRSPLEQYERTDLYGKKYQNWNTPIKDYLKPALYQAINGPFGLVSGAIFGSMFGKNKYSKMVGAVLGMGAVTVGKTYKHTYQVKTGKKWIPKVRQKERDINEYVDILKYLKNTRLYEEYKQKAKVEDHYDVDKYLNDEKTLGANRKERMKELKAAKRYVQINGYTKEAKKQIEQLKVHFAPIDYEGNYKKQYAKEKAEAEKRIIYDLKHRHKHKLPKLASHTISLIETKMTGQKHKTVKNAIHDINFEITTLQNYREVIQVSPNATKAIEYKNKADSTMYAYESGDPIANVLAGMPKKEREYMKYFMKAKQSDKKKILKELPIYVRRPLESTWGMNVEKKENLVDYFQKHQLPGANWAGWKEDFNMDAVKVKLVKHEAMDNSEFNIWSDDVAMANTYKNVGLPRMNDNRSKAVDVRRRLIDVLHNVGIKDANVDLHYTASNVDVNMDLKDDKKDEIYSKLQKSNLS